MRVAKQSCEGRGKLTRYYAVVTVNGQDLAEILVSRGLARVKGASANLEDGVPGKARMRRLKQLEADAKAKRLGVWADSAKEDKRSWLRKIFNW